MLKSLLLLVFVSLASSELLVQIDFSLSATQQFGDYTAADPIGVFLQSTDMKWIRYFTVLVSGQPSAVPQNVAFFMFKDLDAWASFQQANYKTYQALFDHFWVDTRRTMFESVAGGPVYPKSKRTAGQTGGFVWQFLYTVKEGKANELSNYLNSASGAFIADLRKNTGFIERSEFADSFLQTGFTHMVYYDFTDLPSMMESMRGNAYTMLINGMKRYLDTSAVTVLAPGTGDGMYWSALGADPVDGEL
eukprot:TRINITY_DN8424_c0_g1_i2.p1 TRINITY_DN8424_c0_g1~~TRINITY_DN8424_c0_g1_i2.p1  ORF type:complete len:248 (-),score=55.98 TRINITY_DN8424_c0_g1_i2:70-813(-)